MNRELAKDFIRRWGGVLICRSCHHLSPVDDLKADKFVKTGWPKCCGYTMSYEKNEGFIDRY